ncbi:brachyurin [Drosophila grimshawi]|uniref:GH15658 n=1 Tax=Drosophila grimshawi TaxID=7222 RepID=B4IZS4_DROGR|nr:brachyurin [Drosophila grimshawi]EDV95659.1 GH15658 [Drosophila grimshawi]
MRLFVITLCLLQTPSLIVAVVRGFQAKPKQLPYQASLKCYFDNSNDKPHWHGGTIISPRWILTAAHCLQQPKIDLVKVIVTVGVVNKTNREEPGFVEMVVNKEDTIPHDQFNPKTLENDMGLIKLPNDLTLNAYVKAAYLSKQMVYDVYDWFSGRVGIMSGWGLTGSGRPTNMLQYGHAGILHNIRCRLIWQSQMRKTILDTFMCISFRHSGPCRGDSGGPLILEGSNRTLIGVFSHGFDPACRIRMPDIFTRVSYFVDWIEEHTGPL